MMRRLWIPARPDPVSRKYQFLIWHVLRGGEDYFVGLRYNLSSLFQGKSKLLALFR